MMLKVVILSMEGKTNADIAAYFNTDFSNVGVYKNEYMRKDLYPLIAHVKKFAAPRYAMLVPETKKKHNQRYSNADNIIAIETAINGFLEKKYPGQHKQLPRHRIFNIHSERLPKLTSNAWNNMENVLLMARMRVVDKMKLKQVTGLIGDRLSAEAELDSDPELVSNRISSVFSMAFSSEARDVLQEMGIIAKRPIRDGKREQRKKRWSEDQKQAFAYALLQHSGSLREFVKTLPEGKSGMSSINQHWGQGIRDKMKDDQRWQPWLHELTQYPIATFLLYYTDITPQTALDIARRIRNQRGGAGLYKKKQKKDSEKDSINTEGDK